LIEGEDESGLRNQESSAVIQVSPGIRDAPVLRRLAQADLYDLIQQSSLRSFSSGEVLLREGGLPVELFLLLSGRVSILRRDSRGRDRALALRQAGEWIGEMGIVQGVAHSATVVADTPTRVLVVPRDAFKGIVLTSDPATRDLLEILSSRLNESDQLRVGSVAQDSGDTRPSKRGQDWPTKDWVALSGSGSFREATRVFQAELIRQTLGEVSGNVSEAARRLRVARSHLYKLMESLPVPRGSRLTRVDPSPSNSFGRPKDR
jgi:CRP-like cAMP-binding protein